MSLTICSACLESTTGKCPRHSLPTEAAKLAYGWQCPACGRVWAWWFEGPCVCWQLQPHGGSGATVNIRVSEAIPEDEVWLSNGKDAPVKIKNVRK